MGCIVFIDAGHLVSLQAAHGKPKIDLGKALADWCSGPGGDYLFAHYYHCAPYQSPSPTAEELQRQASWDRYQHAISKHTPRLRVKLGKLAYRGMDQAGEKIFEQKRVDVMLAVDMVTLAYESSASHFVLIAGDSDYVPAIESVKAKGKVVSLWHGPAGSVHRELIAACDEHHEITEEHLKSRWLLALS